MTGDKEKMGMPPGTLVHVGEVKQGQEKLRLVTYGKDHFSLNVPETSKIGSVPFGESGYVNWLNLDGLHNVRLVEEIGAKFGLHSLLLEDVLNTKHRPKAEWVDNVLFVTLKMYLPDVENQRIGYEQVSLVLGQNWLISFQEQEGDVLSGLRSRIEAGKGIIRKNGADYLLYRIIDSIVDHYFLVVDYFGDTIDGLEAVVYEDPNQENLRKIQQTRKELQLFKKDVLPLRESIAGIRNEDSDLVSAETDRYLTDVFDHIIHVLDGIETQREHLNSVMDLYLSGSGNKMNQVMQVLTIIATIFIPLTFIAGIYGMNFENMPELSSPYGYQIVWGVMLVLFVGMLYYFRRKRWI